MALDLNPEGLGGVWGLGEDVKVGWAMSTRIDLQVCAQSYFDVMQAACSESWTRDPFDRAIVAQARRMDCPLLTRDRKIRDNYSKAFW